MFRVLHDVPRLFTFCMFMCSCFLFMLAPRCFDIGRVGSRFFNYAFTVRDRSVFFSLVSFIFTMLRDMSRCFARGG